MASNETSSVPARLKDLKDSVKERFLGLLGIRQPKVLLEDEQEVFLQVGRTVWHAPRQLRIELWLSSLARRHSLVSEYQAYLCQEISREAATDIEKDVQRTFPNTRRFHAEEGQTQLRNVLRAYAAYDPEVAYCQGMNFLTGLLLMYMPTDAHAFAALVVLMEDRKLRSFYHRSMSLLQVQLWQLSRLISPSLNQHLETLGVVPMLYGASWLMTAFSADFPIPFSARIMDVLLADQCECALLKVAAAIIKAVGPRLHSMSDLEEVLGYLKLEVPSWDEPDLHDLLTAAFTKPWTPRQLSILRSTEGAETVAQAMDRVMNMHEQLSAQTCDEEEGGEEGGGGDGEARVALTVPRLQPPPQPSNSFTASPACGTPINGGLYGTGSHGGAVSGSPPAHLSGSAAAATVANAANGSSGGAHASALESMNSGSSNTCGSAAPINFQLTASVSGSPAAWGIPCIHPNVPASPAIQAFRRVHLPSLQAAASAATGGSTRFGRSFPLQHPVRSSCGGVVNGADGGHEESGLLSARYEEAEGSPQSGYSSSHRRGSDGCSVEDWGDFNAAAVRQQWRSIVRATPGSTRHVLMHADELSADGPWRGASALSSLSSYGGAQAAPPTPSSRESSGGSVSQPIPVPSGRAGLSSGTSAVGSAFAAAAAFANATVSSLPSATAAVTGKPPLPPRCASLDRAGPPLLGAFSRLSVVAEDHLIVQMGAVAPAPSPRGSMDLHVLGRSGSQQLESCEQQGFLLWSTGVGGAGGSANAANGVGVISASCNGDCMSGTASVTTGGALLSPSVISGVVSPHGLSSPRLASGWCTSGLTGGASGIGVGSAGGANGSDTPTGDYMLLGLERAVSGSLLDYPAGCTGGGGAVLTSVPERSFSTVSPLPPPAATLPPMRPTMASPNDTQFSMLVQDRSQATPNVDPQQIGEQEQQPSDMATDIAGDILRMLSAVDTGNAHAAYDPRAILGESMYADSPNKEEHKLVRRGSETLRHLPSSSALADIAAQDLAKAQEEAERVRLELQAQLEQQRASDRLSSCSASGTERGAFTSVLAASAAAEAPKSGGGMTEAQLAEAAAEAGAVAATAVAAIASAEGAVAAAGSNCSGIVAAAEVSAGTAPPVRTLSAAGGAVAGVDEVVFKRPTLYVDGIPMFDPKSLMADHHEAQVMFTPTVSPGASSYADPVMSGFTPTGDAATPGDLDGGSDGDIEVDSAPHAALTTAVDKWDMPHAGVRSSESGEEATSVASAILEVAEMAPAMAPDNHVNITAQTEAYTVLPVQNGSGNVIVRAAETSYGVEDLTISVSAGPSKAVTAAGGTAVSEEELPTLPLASEWVDWSQAPPIQVAPPVVLPHSQAPVASVSASAAQSAAQSPQQVNSNRMSFEGQAEVPPVPLLHALPSFQLQGPMEQPLNHDLIDMASPVRPTLSFTAPLHLQLSPGAEGCGPSNEIPEAPEHGIARTGTGLSPGAPVEVQRSVNLDAVRQPPGSFSDLAAAGGDASLNLAFCTSTSSSQSPLPYGLLPMASSAVQPPPMAPAISFTSSMAEGPSCNRVCSLQSASMMTGRSTSFVGVLHSELLKLANPSCESLGANIQTSVPNNVAHRSSDESDRCCGFDDNDRERYATCRQTPESPQSYASPKWLLASGPSGGGGDDAVSNGGSHRLANMRSTGLTDAVEGSFCNALGLRVMAEVVFPESSAQEPDFACDSPSSKVGGAAAAITVVPTIAVSVTKPTEATPNGKPHGLNLGSAAQSQLAGKGPAMPRPGSNGGDSGSWSGGLGRLESGIASNGAASRCSLVEHQGSNVEADVEVEELENSPFRAALSPSLAHHIMSAYLRSEQHQQQQEQRELEERLREQERLAQEQLHQVQQLVMELGAPAVAGHASGLNPSDLAGAAAVEVPVFDLSGSAATSMATTAIPVPSLHVGSTVIAINSAVGHAALGGEPSLSSAPVLTVPSGVASPQLESPGRPNAGYGTGYSTTVALPQPYLPSTTKVLTPFALSSGDPSSSRLTAELQQVIPPPLQPLVMHPDTALQHLGSTGCSLHLETKSHVSGLLSLRGTGSGDGGGAVTTTGGAGLSNGALGSAIVVARISSSGATQSASLLVHGASDGSVYCPSIRPSGATAMPADVGTAVGTAELQPPAGHACSIRIGGGSNGGAPLQLLPPPPPPQVPLCTVLEAKSVLPPSLQLPLPLAPVLCSSNATVTAVAEGEGGGGVAACTPVASISGGCNTVLTALLQPAAPTWTATFDGVDDTPTEATADEEAEAKYSSGPEPRVLSSAFSAEADTPPLAQRLEIIRGGGCNAAATTTDISTSEE